MKIEKLRKDSPGIAGTYANANHHAQACVPLIQALESLVRTFGFAKWRQGANVHVFETQDGRRFDMVPYANEQGYIGIEFRRRESRSKALSLAVLQDLHGLGDFVTMIQVLARPIYENRAAKFRYSEM